METVSTCSSLDPCITDYLFKKYCFLELVVNKEFKIKNNPNWNVTLFSKKKQNNGITYNSLFV